MSVCVADTHRRDDNGRRHRNPPRRGDGRKEGSSPLTNIKGHVNQNLTPCAKVSDKELAQPPGRRFGRKSARLRLTCPVAAINACVCTGMLR